ncbi:hypothetical protein SCIM_1287 [Streptococcus intermedius JTH08]|nr:hypothetical protein SCIM_1287 [Streptococcus intermedius JTH08]
MHMLLIHVHCKAFLHLMQKSMKNYKKTQKNSWINMLKKPKKLVWEMLSQLLKWEIRKPFLPLIFQKNKKLISSWSVLPGSMPLNGYWLVPHLNTSCVMQKLTYLLFVIRKKHYNTKIKRDWHKPVSPLFYSSFFSQFR